MNQCHFTALGDGRCVCSNCGFITDFFQDCGRVHKKCTSRVPHFHTAIKEQIKPLVIVMKSKVGDRLEQRFSTLGLRPVAGCPCKDLQRELNRHSVEEIEVNLTAWATKLQSSARKWKELKGGIWNFIPTPPLALCEKILRDAIEEEKCSGVTA